MKATRDSFGETVTALGEKNSRIVVLDADLSKSTKSAVFGEKFPDRFFQMGIAESNMIGTAAGLALSGKIPFCCSFGAFITGRYDQIRMSIGYNQANVKLVGTHAGVAIGEDGHSQMGLEDMATLRSLPNMVIIQPADHQEAVQAVQFAAEHIGPVYLRLTRQKMKDISDPKDKFEVGKWKLLHQGSKIALLGTGELVHSCLEANQNHQSAFTVVNCSSIKPIDEVLLEELSKTHEWIVTAEDHYTVGGLGSAVAEKLAEWGSPAKLYRIGVKTFGESGSPEDVLRHFELDTKGVDRQIRQLLAA